MRTKKPQIEVLEEIKSGWARYRAEVPMAINACILAANYTHRVLDAFEIKHQVRPIGATIFNRKGWELFPTPANELPPEAWSVHCSSRSEHVLMSGWSGHLVVETAEYFIDLSANQFSRPGHQITILGPLIVPRSSIKELPSGTPIHDIARADQAFIFDLGSGVYTFYYEDWNLVYKKARDWSRSFREMGLGEVVQAIQVK
jgi:hypothetical protein